MNLKISKLVDRAKELGNQSVALKQSKLYAAMGGSVSLNDIKLAVDIVETPELIEELFNNYQKIKLHEKIVKIKAHIDIIQTLNGDDNTTEQERETYLATINHMLNQRALL